MPIDQIRRNALDLWLQAVRMPLTAAETVLKRGQDTAMWPPAIAFEKVEATVKGVVGNLVHDDTLVGQANLQRAEVAKREEALLLRADAEATRAEVQRESEAKDAELQRRREQTERAAAEREERIEREASEAERTAKQQGAKKRAATRKQAVAQEDAIDTAAAKAEATRLRKEAEALRAKERAVAKEGEVLDLDRSVQAKKAARRAG